MNLLIDSYKLDKIFHFISLQLFIVRYLTTGRQYRPAASIEFVN